MEVGLSLIVQGVHLRNEAIVSRTPLVLVMPVSGLHINLVGLKDEETP